MRTDVERRRLTGEVTMAFFVKQTEAEKFVRAHCLFITTYFLNTMKSIYCSRSLKASSGVFASGNDETVEGAWEETEESVRRHLAKLETLGGLIEEVHFSTLPSKLLLDAMLRKKFDKARRGAKL
jgi:hypothetical protein